MAVTIRFLGHSGFQLDIDGHKLLIDPWLSGNPAATMAAEDLDGEVILLTHAHDDHVADAADIANRTGAAIVCNFEMGNWYMAQGQGNVFQGNPGGSFHNDWMSAKWTVAHHSSSFGDGSYGGQPNGFVIRGGGWTIYHAGDTSLFGDMRLIGDEDLDLAIIPIGDLFTMGIDDCATRDRIVLGGNGDGHAIATALVLPFGDQPLLLHQQGEAALQHPRWQFVGQSLTDGVDLHAFRMGRHDGENSVELLFRNSLWHAWIICRKNAYATYKAPYLS